MDWWEEFASITDANGRWNGRRLSDCTPLTWKGIDGIRYDGPHIPVEPGPPRDLVHIEGTHKYHTFIAAMPNDPSRVLHYTPRIAEVCAINYAPRPYLHPQEIPHLLSRIYARKWAETHGRLYTAYAIFLLTKTIFWMTAPGEDTDHTLAEDLELVRKRDPNGECLHVSFRQNTIPWREELVIRVPQTTAELETCHQVHRMLDITARTLQYVAVTEQP